MMNAQVWVEMQASISFTSGASVLAAAGHLPQLLGIVGHEVLKSLLFARHTERTRMMPLIDPSMINDYC